MGKIDIYWYLSILYYIDTSHHYIRIIPCRRQGCSGSQWGGIVHLSIGAQMWVGVETSLQYQYQNQTNCRWLFLSQPVSHELALVVFVKPPKLGSWILILALSLAHNEFYRLKDEVLNYWIAVFTQNLIFDVGCFWRNRLNCLAI